MHSLRRCEENEEKQGSEKKETKIVKLQRFDPHLSSSSCSSRSLLAEMLSLSSSMTLPVCRDAMRE